MVAPLVDKPRLIWEGLRRGLLGKCPNCGRGALYRAFLKIEAQCAECGHDNGQYRADDGPAHLTILVVSFVMIVPLLLVSLRTEWSTASILAVFVPAVVLLTLGVLPRVKGAFIGAQWALSGGEA